MSDKELIKQEIERRIESMNSCPFKTAELGSEKFAEGELYAYKQILQFIDSLPKEPASEDLEEEIDRFEEWLNSYNQSDYPTSYTVRDIARHFAEWQKNQMKETLQTEYEKGRFDMREGMMKEAIDATILDIKNHNRKGRKEMKNKLKSFIEEKKFTARVTDGWGYYKCDDAVWVEDILKFLKSHKEEKNEWVKIDKKHPLPKFEEVLGFNKEWIEADFNPKGVRIGYLTDEGNFISAKYNPDEEDYISKYEEGDDYQFFEEMEDGTRKTWYNNGDDRGDIQGYRPNLPTHYKKIDGLEED